MDREKGSGMRDWSWLGGRPWWDVGVRDRSMVQGDKTSRGRRLADFKPA